MRDLVTKVEWLMDGIVITGVSGSSVVVVTLYGEVTPERLEREQRIANHRAEQLAYVPRQKRREREYVEYSNLLD